MPIAFVKLLLMDCSPATRAEGEEGVAAGTAPEPPVEGKKSQETAKGESQPSEDDKSEQ
ncbi:hypothetical protein KDA_36920 [Dictyobacter alpinus]|uniref:Uncharacterized protein n=1 Tax=Dictyobacter alpinus TaxID=2014873 RepID=A0A402BA05_9CHLR|nr:hypothetical protein KDA_36920 [Dictyobacter alpinus]